MVPEHRLGLKMESAFERFKAQDAVLNAYPIHARDYAEQLHELDPNLRISAEAKLNLIAKRILLHRNAIENHAECVLCQQEPIWIRRIVG